MTCIVGKRLVYLSPRTLPFFSLGRVCIIQTKYMLLKDFFLILRKCLFVVLGVSVVVFVKIN